MIRMNYRNRKKSENAVSPVVGVMLMLVVTIIIAAVVSGFAGGLIGGNNQKTPILSMDVKITNSGNFIGSGFSATVLSISEPVPAKNVKIATSWVTSMKDNTKAPGSTYSTIPNGQGIVGGNSTGLNATIPYGFGPGITGYASVVSPYTVNQSFRNITLKQGTGLIAEPASTYSGYNHVTSDMDIVLGGKWELLQTGDVVTVRVVYLPTGKTMFQKEIVVTEA